MNASRDVKVLQLVRCVTLCLALTMFGCQRGPAIAPVTGKVTFENKPLAGGMVEFQPERGAPSYGYTDEEGVYDLQYQINRKGALLGTHVVSVTTAGEVTDPRTGDTRKVRETIPPEFNVESKMTYDVHRGRNEFDITIPSRRPN